MALESEVYGGPCKRSTVRKAPAPKVAESEWLRVQGIIVQLYLVDGMTLDKIRSKLSAEWGFNASKSQYLTKLNAWNVFKYSTGDFWRGVHQGLKRRQLEPAESVVYFNEQEVPLKKVKKESRHNRSAERAVDEAQYLRTPPGIYITPASRSSASIFPEAEQLHWLSSDITSLSTGFAQPSRTSNYGHELIVSDGGSGSRVELPAAAISAAEHRSLQAPTLDLSYTSIATLLKTESHFGQAKITAREYLRQYGLEDYHVSIQETATGSSGLRLTNQQQALSTLTSTLLSNNLVWSWQIGNFIAKVPEYALCMYLKRLLLEQASPFSNAAASRILMAATKTGALNVLRQGLRYGADVNMKLFGDEYGPIQTLLQLALESDQVSVAQLLLDHGADVNVSSKEKFHENHNVFGHIDECDAAESHVEGFQCKCQWTGFNSPIAIAARSSKCSDLIPNLLENGAKLPDTPLLIHAIERSASIDVIRQLIHSGSDLNVRIYYADDDPMTETHALSAAAVRRNIDLIDLLLENGAAPDGGLAADLDEGPSVHDGSFLRHGESLRSPLFCVADLSSADSYSESLKIAGLLLEHGADPNLSSFEFWIKDGRGISLERFADVVIGDRWEFEPIVFYPIQAAVMSGDAALVDLLLKHGALLRPRCGTALLTMAISHGHDHLVEALLRYGACPNDPGFQRRRRSPLVAAIIGRKFKLVRTLLRAGADANALMTADYECSPLQAAATIGDITTVELLIQNGASPAASVTTLLAAAVVGDRTIIELLLQHGASLAVGAMEEHGLLLQAFVTHGHHDYLKQALAACAKPNSLGEDGSSPLMAALVEADMISLRLLRDAGANLTDYMKAIDRRDAEWYDWQRLKTPLFETVGGIPRYQALLSPIQWAAALGHIEVVIFLCKEGASIDQKASPESGMMALQLAVCMNQTTMVEFLLRNGSDINAQSETIITYEGLLTAEQVSTTPLGGAVVSHNMALMHYLIANGADPNQQLTVERKGPRHLLDYACEYGHRRLEIVEALLIAGADIGAGDPLRSALQSWRKEERHELVRLLMHRGATSTDPQNDNYMVLCCAISDENTEWVHMLLDLGVAVNGGDLSFVSDTPLQKAAKMGNVDLVERLIALGADVNASAHSELGGCTALQAAAAEGYLKIVQILLDYGADICAPAPAIHRHTAIQEAARNGRFSTVKLLLDQYRGPRVFKLQVEAYEAAKKTNQWHIVDLLETYRRPQDGSR